MWCIVVSATGEHPTQPSLRTCWSSVCSTLTVFSPAERHNWAVPILSSCSGRKAILCGQGVFPSYPCYTFHCVLGRTSPPSQVSPALLGIDRCCALPAGDYRKSGAGHPKIPGCIRHTVLCAVQTVQQSDNLPSIQEIDKGGSAKYADSIHINCYPATTPPLRKSVSSCKTSQNRRSSPHNPIRQNMHIGMAHTD